MAKYINKDELLAVVDRLIVPEAAEAMKDIANSMPSADVVAVVRCKDCVSKDKAKVNSKGFLICPDSGMEICDADYCSYAERRKSE